MSDKRAATVRITGLFASLLVRLRLRCADVAIEERAVNSGDKSAAGSSVGTKFDTSFD